MNQNNHVRFVIGCITILAGLASLAGAFLLWRGYSGGSELVMTVNTAIAGMIGFLSNRQQTPEPPKPTPTTEITQPTP